MTARHVMAALTSAGVTTGGWTLLEGGLSDRVTGPQIAVLDRAGLPPWAAHGTAGIMRAGIQVLVRGDANTYETTRTKAALVWTTLQRKRFANLQSVEGVNNPIWLGFEPQTARPMWSLNFIAITT